MKKNLKIISAFISFLFIFSNLLYADSDLILKGFRQRGMGGAGVAVANDLEALIINPACLSQIKGLKFRLVGGRVEINQKAIDKQDKLTDILNNLKNQKELATLIKEIVPSKLAANASATPFTGIGWTGFGVGLFAQGNSFIEGLNQGNPRFQFTGLSDLVGAAGLALNVNVFGIMPMVFGGSGKYVVRTNTYGTDGTNTVVYQFTDIMKMMNDSSSSSTKSPGYYQVSGLAFDFGGLSKFDTPVGLGRFGFVVKNIAGELTGDKTINEVTTTGFSEQLPIVSTLGFGLDTSIPFPFIGGLLTDLTFAADYDIVSKETSPYKKLHIGVEKSLLWWNMLKLRAGLDQGFIVGGFGVDFLAFHLNYVSYTNARGSEIGIDDQQFHVIETGVYF